MYSKENSRIEDDYRVYTGLTNKGKCIFCGDEFYSRSIKAKYCSQRCKNDKQIERRAEIVFIKKSNLKNCLVCNTNIKQSPKAKIKKYCSNKCKQIAYRKSKK